MPKKQSLQSFQKLILKPLPNSRQTRKRETIKFATITGKKKKLPQPWKRI